jgi:hypothetical protein
MVIRILDIADCHSDGDPSKWPTPDKGYKRNDDYFLQKIANDFWVKEWDPIDLGGPPSSAQWRLNLDSRSHAPIRNTSTGTCTVTRGVNSDRCKNSTLISST